eukprot:PhF_6_TR34976/c0_g1_i1/m.50796/K00939/adk, AK; adenylate kinase
MAFFDIDNRIAFVTECDTILGSEIARKLSTASEPYKVYGSLRNEKSQPKWVTGVVSRRTDPVAFKAQILLSDLVVCPLTDSLDEASAAIKILSSAQCNVEKTYVLVSSIMTWSRTNEVAREKQRAEKEAERAARLADGEELGDEPPAEEEEFPPIVEDDYKKRIPNQRYNEWKKLEQSVKHANSGTLHTYVICAGLQYGLGEDKLLFLFRRVYMNDPSIILPNFEGGKNVVPTVHVADVATLAVKLGTSNEVLDKRYYLAVDEGNNTWASIIQTFAAMTKSKQQLVYPYDYALYPFVEHFLVDMKMDIGEMGNLVEDWVCKQGLVAGAPQIWKEYCKAHDLAPIRIVIGGPPLSGKSEVSKAVASYYDVPYLAIADIISNYEDAVHEKSQELDKYVYEKRKEKKSRELEAARAKAAEGIAAAGEDGEGAPPPPAADGENTAAPPVVDIYADLDDPEMELLRALDNEEAPKEGEAAAEGDEDETLAKLKTEAETMKKVLTMKHMLPKAPEVTEAGEADAAAEGEAAAPKKVRPWVAKGYPNAEGRKLSTTEEGSAAVAAPPQPENIGRYMDRALAMMVRWRLQQPDCTIKGYVLDSFPKTSRQVRLTFMEGALEPLDAGEDGVIVDEDTDENVLTPLDDALTPEYFINLKAAEGFLLHRLYSSQNATSHHTLKAFHRRMKLFNDTYSGSNPKTSFRSFVESIQTNKSRELIAREIVVASDDWGIILDIVNSVVGAPHNLGPTAAQIAVAEDRARREAERIREQEQNRENERVQLVTKAQADDTDQRNREIARVQTATQQILDMKNIHDRDMRSFLMTNVIPAITEALREVSELRPEDPVSFVSDRVFHFVERTAAQKAAKK